MATPNNVDKDIIEKLNEISLEINWGTVERVDGVPKAVAVIQEAMAYITELRKDLKYWENAWFEKDKKEDELIMSVQKAERERYEKSSLLCMDMLEQKIAKEVLQSAFEAVKSISGKDDCVLEDESVYEDSSLVNALNIVGKKYGVEIDENV